MPYTTTFTDPPTAGTIETTWEGWVRVDELLPCDVIVQSGEAIQALVADGEQTIVVVNGLTEGSYENDDVFYIERAVTLTVALGG